MIGAICKSTTAGHQLRHATLLLLLLLACACFAADPPRHQVLVVHESAQPDDNGYTSGDTRDNDAVAGEPFVATSEWQEIKPGHIVPPGLHYRVNLETGKREAKLLDTDERPIDEERGDENLANERARIAKLTDMYKKVIRAKNQQVTASLQQIANDPKHRPTHDPKQTATTADTLHRFKTIDDIKREFDESAIHLSTETEVVIELLEKYRRLNDRKDADSANKGKVNILADVEYNLHNIDGTPFTSL